MGHAADNERATSALHVMHSFLHRSKTPADVDIVEITHDYACHRSIGPAMVVRDTLSTSLRPKSQTTVDEVVTAGGCSKIQYWQKRVDASKTWASDVGLTIARAHHFTTQHRGLWLRRTCYRIRGNPCIL
ncbi:unnamed protein product [Toxocara canis]|uniref:Uncharacterized protein n=1 Tax=Toxocara canis TaxID=6265 RepID=A0A183V6P9_TOXCA|nr:unnamed protein product [Toxocara canis]